MRQFSIKFRINLVVCHGFCLINDCLVCFQSGSSLSKLRLLFRSTMEVLCKVPISADTNLTAYFTKKIEVLAENIVRHICCPSS